MNTLHIGIATYEEMKARTMAIARGELRPDPDDPKVWFTSLNSLAKVLSEDNRALLHQIAKSRPASLDELAKESGRKKSNLSRTLKTMAGYGLVELERGERGRISPRVTFDKLMLEIAV